jgi:hypothetical protein
LFFYNAGLFQVTCFLFFLSFFDIHLMRAVVALDLARGKQKGIECIP